MNQKQEPATEYFCNFCPQPNSHAEYTLTAETHHDNQGTVSGLAFATCKECLAMLRHTVFNQCGTTEVEPDEPFEEGDVEVVITINDTDAGDDAGDEDDDEDGEILRLCVSHADDLLRLSEHDGHIVMCRDCSDRMDLFMSDKPGTPDQVGATVIPLSCEVCRPRFQKFFASKEGSKAHPAHPAHPVPSTQPGRPWVSSSRKRRGKTH